MNSSYLCDVIPMSKKHKKHIRNSNIELFRIITMLAIVAHHYVVNSGLLAIDGPIYSDGRISLKSAFILLFGALGKTGINCFVLITGYFMCKSNITLTKFLKLIFEIYFYRIIIYLIFLLTGYTSFSFTGFVKVLLPFVSIGNNFTGCYIVFFLFIPFLNVLVKNITQKQHTLLLVLSLGIYAVFGSIPYFSISFNYVTWFCICYFISSYIRLYPNKLFSRTRLWGWLSLVLIIAAYASVLICTYILPKFGFEPCSSFSYYFLVDSNKIFAVLISISSFLFFKNVKVKQSAFINSVASTTFGVFLIHANSDTMRYWLWNDTLKNVQMYDSTITIIHAIGCVAAVFAVCSVIDYIRIKLFEEPLFKKFGCRFDNLEISLRSIFNNFYEKLLPQK